MTSEFTKEYQSKLATIDQVLDDIKSGEAIRCGGNCCRPLTFYENAHKLKGKVENVRILPAGALFSMFPFTQDPELKGCIETYSSFYDEGARRAQKNGTASYIPVHLHNTFSRGTDAYGCDRVFVTVSPMDKNGYFFYSLDNLFESEAIRYSIENGKKIVVEVNPNMPRIFGETEIHISDVDYIVEAERSMFIVPDISINEEEYRIARHIASLIEDGSTIQLGFGGIPNAVATLLKDKNDLGVHSEMITSSMAELAMLGVINGRRKTLHWGKMIGAFSLGTQDLYDYLNDNPSVRIFPASYVNDPGIIARNDRMVSINAGLQVDLTGQICSESLGTRQYSGIGGALDFAIGASHSKGGKSIIALRTTAKKVLFPRLSPHWISVPPSPSPATISTTS
jgi:acyl-CoA hydrolase